MEEIINLVGANNKKGIHFAILREPFYSLIIGKAKTIESRWMKNNISPRAKGKDRDIFEGDIIIIKKAGEKYIEYYFEAGEVLEFSVTPYNIEMIKKEYAEKIRVSEIDIEEFLYHKKRVVFIEIKNLTRLPFSVKLDRRAGDRRAWIVLRKKQTPTKSISSFIKP